MLINVNVNFSKCIKLIFSQESSEEILLILYATPSFFSKINWNTLANGKHARKQRTIDYHFTQVNNIQVPKKKCKLFMFSLRSELLLGQRQQSPKVEGVKLIVKRQLGKFIGWNWIRYSK